MLSYKYHCIALYSTSNSMTPNLLHKQTCDISFQRPQSCTTYRAYNENMCLSKTHLSYTVSLQVVVPLFLSLFHSQTQWCHWGDASSRKLKGHLLYISSQLRLHIKTPDLTTNVPLSATHTWQNAELAVKCLCKHTIVAPNNPRITCPVQSPSQKGMYKFWLILSFPPLTPV